MTKIPDARTLLVECLGALNWVPNQELPEGSNYGDTYALAAHVAARLNIMRDVQSRAASLTTTEVRARVRAVNGLPDRAEYVTVPRDVWSAVSDWANED